LDSYGLGKKARNAGSVNALQYPPQFKRLLQVTVLAAVKAALTAGNPFLALWRNRNPVLNLCVPVQIAIINYLAFFQDPRASRGPRYCLFRLTHGASLLNYRPHSCGSLLSYQKGESRKGKAEGAKAKAKDETTRTRENGTTRKC